MPQTILDSITDAFFSQNADWEFCYVNRQTEKVLGYQASELLMKSLWEVFRGKVGSEFERMYRKAAEQQLAQAFGAYVGMCQTQQVGKRCAQFRVPAKSMSLAD